jgi:hypothetical protein
LSVPPKPLRPAWDGIAPIAGRTLLLVGDTNLGADIMLLRYARVLIERGAKVVAAVPPVLKPLVDCLDGVTAISEGSPRFDRWLGLTSLPFRLEVEGFHAPARFELPPAQVDAWCIPIRERSKGRRQVGLCWSGNPASPHWRSRDIPLRALEPLLAVPNVDFYALQVAVRDEDRPSFDAADVFDVGKKFRSLRDTACVISGLELVITIDTAVAHLTASLGVPTWVMLQAGWIGGIWVPGRDDCALYPAMRAFRQTNDGDWAGVVQSVLTSLRAFAASHSSMKERVNG